MDAYVTVSIAATASSLKSREESTQVFKMQI